MLRNGPQRQSLNLFDLPSRIKRHLPFRHRLLGSRPRISVNRAYFLPIAFARMSNKRSPPANSEKTNWEIFDKFSYRGLTNKYSGIRPSVAQAITLDSLESCNAPAISGITSEEAVA